MSQILRALAPAELPQCQFLHRASIFYRACKNTQILPKATLIFTIVSLNLFDTLGEDVTKVDECLRVEALQNCVNKNGAHLYSF